MQLVMLMRDVKGETITMALIENEENNVMYQM
jgi:hypothetical protein